MRKRLSKSEIKEINTELAVRYSTTDFFDKKDIVELIDELYIVRDKYVALFFHDGVLYPSLHTLLAKNFLPVVTVDKGAVKFMASGADVMRPGIVAIDSVIKQGSAVVIIDETHKKPLCVGIALFDAEPMREQARGKSVTTIHYISDEIWNYSA